MATTALAANQQNNINTIPGFESQTFSGIPIKGFIKNQWRKIRASLGNISQDGSTMLDVLDQKDPGAGAGTPGGAGTVAQQAQHAARERRLYNIICKLTDPACALTSMLESDYVDQGRLAALYFRDENNLPLSQDERDKLQSDWTAASVITLNIPVNSGCLYALYNWIRDKSADFVPAKDNTEQYNKILAGAPECLFSEAVREQKRMNLRPPQPSYVFPAVYPAGHPQDGNVHANAGEPDPLSLVKALSAHLRIMIDKGLVRVKADKVNEVEEDNDADIMAIGKFKGSKPPYKRTPMGKDKSGKPVELTETSRCFRCGGLGHFAVTNGQKCLTAMRISRDILDNITYPHIKNERPVPKNLTVNEISDSDESDDAEGEEIEAIEECDEGAPDFIGTVENANGGITEENFLQDFS